MSKILFLCPSLQMLHESFNFYSCSHRPMVLRSPSRPGRPADFDEDSVGYWEGLLLYSLDHVKVYFSPEKSQTKYSMLWSDVTKKVTHTQQDGTERNTPTEIDELFRSYLVIYLFIYVCNYMQSRRRETDYHSDSCFYFNESFFNRSEVGDGVDKWLVVNCRWRIERIEVTSSDNLLSKVVNRLQRENIPVIYDTRTWNPLYLVNSCKRYSTLDWYGSIEWLGFC